MDSVGKDVLHRRVTLNATARGSDLSLADVGIMLESVGISKSSTSMQFLTELSSVFEIEGITEDGIEKKLNDFYTSIDNDPTIPSNEKDALLAATALLRANFKELANELYQTTSELGGRTNGWFKKVWRVVRSVVLTAAVGVLIGASVASGVGAIIGGAVMAGLAITDAAANDYCHFAMQCDGGWRQDCTTGDCVPY